MANKKIPLIKKNIEAFLTSEEGKISKKSALELGLGVALLSLLASKAVVIKEADAFTSHISHSSHSYHSSCVGACMPDLFCT